MTHSVKEILLITLSNIGDVILTTPVMAAVKEAFSAASLDVVAGPKAVGLLKKSRSIRHLFVYDKHASVWKQIEFIFNLRRQAKYDYVIDLRHTMIPWLVRARRRSPAGRRFKNENVRERHLEVLSMMKIPFTGSEIFDFFGDEEKTSLEKIFRQNGIRPVNNGIVVSPIAASELKTWKLENFRQVLDGLLKFQAGPIFLVGDERERGMMASLTTLNPGRVINLGGQTNLRELACLVSQSSLVLANDSAVMHLGFELKRPVVAVFGPTDFRKYGHEGALFRVVRSADECVPCGSPVCKIDRRSCLDDLSPDSVLNVCLELLNHAR